MTFLSYYYFRYLGPHYYFRLSADIDSIRDSSIKLLDPASVEVIVGTALLSSLEADIYVHAVLTVASNVKTVGFLAYRMHFITR